MASARIRFLGAAGEVTGSCHLVEVGSRRVLLDCGLFQGAEDAEARNRASFPFDPKTIDAVILSHAHLDHSGRLPSLTKFGFRGAILTHPATRDLARIMLKDSAHLAERDAETESRKNARRGLTTAGPLYTLADVETCLPQFQGLDYGEHHEVVPGVSCRLQGAGHILGAAVTELWVEGSGRTHKLVFSGDLGGTQNSIMRPPAHVEDADLVVMESTYGDRRHRSYAATVAELGAILNEAHMAGGNVLIPAFAVGRTQELLYLFAQHSAEWNLQHWHIFLDSPMAIEATAAYAAHAQLLRPAAARYAGVSGFSSSHVHFCASTEDSIALNRIDRGAIIIAGSGMCTGGRIRHHFKHRLWRDDTHVVMVGFQAAGTLGRHLVEGAREIALWGETVRVAAKIHTLGGFSAHADQSGLCEWYGAFRHHPPTTLVHGEHRAISALSAELRTRFGCTVNAPVTGEILELASLPDTRLSEPT